ncbi:hypothetical protein SNE40_009258 [Patella caerulea]
MDSAEESDSESQLEKFSFGSGDSGFCTEEPVVSLSHDSEKKKRSENKSPSTCNQTTPLSHHLTSASESSTSVLNTIISSPKYIDYSTSLQSIPKSESKTSVSSYLKRKVSIDSVSSSDQNSNIKITKPDSSESQNVKQKRFNRTAKALRDSGLLPIAIKTGNLMKKNMFLQKEIQNLKKETALFLQSIQAEGSDNTEEEGKQ